MVSSAEAMPSAEVALAQVAALVTSGDREEARRQCAAALLRWPSNAHLHYMIGVLCTTADEHGQAEAHAAIAIYRTGLREGRRRPRGQAEGHAAMASAKSGR